MTGEPEKDIFPADDVDASVADRELQRRHALDALDTWQRTTLDYLRGKAIDEGASERANWVFFCSPQWTWEQECGREGWLLYDEETQTQHAFWMTAMN